MSLGLEALPSGEAPVEAYEFTLGERVWRYTSHDQPLVVRGQRFEPHEISRGAVRESGEADSGTLEITLPATDPVPMLFVGYLPPDPVRVIVYSGQRQDSEPGVLFRGEVGSPRKAPDGTATMTCTSQAALLEDSIPSLVYQSPCGHLLFGAGCGLDESQWRTPGLVVGISGAELTVSIEVLPEDGYFERGRILSASGERRQIIAHVGNRMTLNAPLRDVAVGEHATLWPGCDHTEATCRDRFGNILNHIGFSRMPRNNPWLTRYR